MWKNKAVYNYYIVQDNFSILFPEQDYTVEELYEWYKVIPTNPKVIGYYGVDEQLIKRHFEKMLISDEVKTRKSNTLHAEDNLNVNVLVVYNRNGKCVGFAAQEWRGNWGKEKKAIYLNEFNKEEYSFG